MSVVAPTVPLSVTNTTVCPFTGWPRASFSFSVRVEAVVPSAGMVSLSRPSVDFDASGGSAVRVTVVPSPVIFTPPAMTLTWAVPGTVPVSFAV